MRWLRETKMEQDAGLYADIVAIYPLGKPSISVFMSAQWIFDADGGFAFIPQVPLSWHIGAIQLLGRYERRGPAVEFHGSFHSSRDGILTLDGLLHPGADGVQMEAI
jgi:hypothetical protein